MPTDANGFPTQVEGTLSRNCMRGLGAWQTDFAVHRQFNLTERISLQFRGEFFNVFNHPNFGNIDNLLSDGLFGRSNATLNANYANYGTRLNPLYSIGGPRSIQLALKVLW